MGLLYHVATWSRLGLAALLTVGSLAARAQTFAYPSNAAYNSVGTYTDLGTTGTAIATANTDDANSTAQDIGFTFSYNGTAFTQFVLNTNGYLKLGATAPVAPYFYASLTVTTGGPLNSTTDANLILPFNTDLTAGATSPTEYRVATTGATGSRVCTIQWKNVSDKASAISTQYANISFQVKLYEGSNQVEFVYGTATSGATGTATPRTVAVGLKGSSSTNSQLLTVQKASVDPWSSSRAQNADYPVATGNLAPTGHNIRATVLPEAGRTYRFTAPTCPSPLNLAVRNVTTTSATITFTAPSNGTAYALIYGPPSFDPTTSGTVIQTTATSYTLTGLTPGNGYDVYAVAQCGPNDQSFLSNYLAFSTPCATTPVVVSTFPYVENFDAVQDGTLPCGSQVLDANRDGYTWEVISDEDFSNSKYNALAYIFNDANATVGADDWAFTPGLSLKAGYTYQLQFSYAAADNGYTESLEVKYGTAATPAGLTNQLFSTKAITNEAYITTTTSQVAAITPTADGVYYIGFHATSAPNQGALLLDDLRVTENRVLAVRNAANSIFTVEAAPVPFGETLTLTLNTRKAGPMQLTLRDALGRVLRKTTTPAAVGTSTLAVPEVGHLPAGIYFLNIEQGGQSQVLRVAHQ
jgi:hypothetical protein